MRRLLSRGVLIGLLLGGWLSVSTVAQPGPYAAQIQRALNGYVSTPHTWTTLQTFSGGIAGGGNGIVPTGVAAGSVLMSNGVGAQGFWTMSPNIAGQITSTVTTAEVLRSISGGTGPMSIRLGNSGNNLYLGTEGATSGGFFTGSLAYSSVFYSNTAIQNIVGGVASTIITTNGNFGIRTTAPAAQFSVGGPGSASYTADITGSFHASTSLTVGTTNILSGAAPTISSGFGTTPSMGSGGAAAFTVNVGTGGTATNGVIGLPTATNGWRVSCDDLTTQSAIVFQTRQIATTTTTATIANFTTAGAQGAWVASNILSCSAVGY